MKRYCFYCKEKTETSDSDCTVCGLSKTNASAGTTDVEDINSIRDKFNSAKVIPGQEISVYEIGGRVDGNEVLEEFRKAEKIADEKSVSPATKEEQIYLERFPEDKHEYELEKLRLERFEKKLAKVQHAATKKKSKFTKSNKKESKNLKSARKKSKKQNRR